MSDYIQITDEQFVEAIHAVVEERGRDFIYPKGETGWARPFINLDGSESDELNDTCLYVRRDTDEPACLIGAALHKAGVPLAELRAEEGQGPFGFFRRYGLSHAITEAAGAAQVQQDGGTNWGGSLERFDEELRQQRLIYKS